MQEQPFLTLHFHTLKSLEKRCETCKMLMRINPDADIIFVTAYSEHMADAFSLPPNRHKNLFPKHMVI